MRARTRARVHVEEHLIGAVWENRLNDDVTEQAWSCRTTLAHRRTVAQQIVRDFLTYVRTHVLQMCVWRVCVCVCVCVCV